MSKNSRFNAAWLNERAEYFDGVYNELKSLKNKAVFTEKRIAVVGVWSNAAEINKILCRLDLKISIISENNPNKQGLLRLGILSQSVESLVNEKNVIILALNNNYWQDIRKQLLNLGFVENSDFFIIFGGEKFKIASGGYNEYSLLADYAWEDLCKRAERGYNAYVKLSEKYPSKYFWLMHQPSLGDLYIFSMFLPTALNVSSINECDCVLIVTKNSVKKLAEAIGFKNIVLISFEEVNQDWLVALKLMGDKMNRIHNSVYHGLNNIFESLVWNTKVTFRDSFTKYVFHFTDEVKPVYPTFPKRRDVVSAEFEKLGLKKGKTVVISPYIGHSEAAITLKHWKRLTEALIDKGYTLCTNCGNDEEFPLSGTLPAFIELQDCVEFAEFAGYFIGVRSGFCDLLCMANCKKIVIYETGSPAASIDFFGFKSMGLGDDNIVEVVNDCIHTDELIDEIISYF